jgi:hypothetical protein
MAILDKEIETFEKNKSKLVEEHKDKYVLIKDDKIIDIFFDKRDAINRGYKEFPNKPFLVKKIEETSEVQNLVNFGVKLECLS